MSDPPGPETFRGRTSRYVPDRPDHPLGALTELCEAQTEVIRVLRASLNQAQEMLADHDRERVGFAKGVGLPLNRVLSDLERLAVADLPDDTVATVLHLAQEVDRLVRLVASHALEPSSHLRPPPSDLQLVDLGSLTHEVLREAGPALAGHPIEVRIAPGVHIQTAPAMVKRVLLHLVLNAGQHTPPGTKIELAGERSGAGIAMRVCDRGPGLPREINLGHLELRPDGTAGPGGGLGLLTARTIAESLGGLIGIVGRLGGGVEATFWLPDPASAGSAAASR